MAKHIVLVGKGAGILQAVSDLLTAQGHQVTFFQATPTTDISEIGATFQGQPVDLVVIGAALAEEQRQVLRRGFTEVHPDVAFFQASGPIPPMIAQQIAALFAGKQPFPTAPTYDAAQKTLKVTIPAATTGLITCYWIVSQELVTSTSSEVLNGPLQAGEHTFAVPDDAATHWSFATVDTPDFFTLVPLAPRQ